MAGITRTYILSLALVLMLTVLSEQRSVADESNDDFYKLDAYEPLPNYQIDRLPGSAYYHWYCRKSPSVEGYEFKRRRAKLMGSGTQGMLLIARTARLAEKPFYSCSFDL